MKTGIIFMVMALLLLASCTMKNPFEKSSDQKIIEQIQKENNEPLQPAVYAVSGEKKYEIYINAADMQAIVDRTPAFRELPKDSAFVFTFFDGNGNMRSDMAFTVVNGKVIEGKAESYDFNFITGDYWYPVIAASSDLCSAMQQIRNAKDYRFERKTGVIEVAIKYAGMMKYKSCLGL